VEDTFFKNNFDKGFRGWTGCRGKAVAHETQPCLNFSDMQEFSALDGALLVDKPAGPTSHDIVDTIRRHFGLKKVGHCGTLDPNATGLLIIVLGRGTKLSERLMSDDKVYEGTMKLGETTDSYDADGELVRSLPIPALTLEELNSAAAEFIGDQMQVPPMVSAVKKGGVPLYKLARRGLEVQREARLIHIYSFKFGTYKEPIGWFRVACTKGTYVRSLTHELGEKLGCGGHLATLRRVSSGKFNAADAIPFEELFKLTTAQLEKRVIPFLTLAAREEVN
jgi:tRNA pseudouridine55 synthase